MYIAEALDRSEIPFSVINVATIDPIHATVTKYSIHLSINCFESEMCSKNMFNFQRFDFVDIHEEIRNLNATKKNEW